MTERLATLMVWLSALLVSGIFFAIVGEVMLTGWPHLSWEFLTSLPLDAGRAGGLISILISTLWIVLLCLLISVPLAIATAVLLVEYLPADSVFARGTQYSLDVLAGVPSIVFGLFGNAVFCIYLGMGFSILSGSLTLACMVLPFLIRAIEVGLRGVPTEYRHAAAALGLSRYVIWQRILLPVATPSVVVGIALALGRALGETAALIFTSGYVDRMPESWFDSGRTLALHVYDLAMNVPGGSDAAYATAAVLIMLLISINLATAWLSARTLQRGVLQS
jgi:phosphate transport system permease protein